MIILFVILVLPTAIILFLRAPQFGGLPKGAALAIIEKSANYKNGKFQNIHHTPDLKEGTSYFTVMRKFFFGKDKRSRPATTLPSVKTDLEALVPDKNMLVWFGHSSYFLQIDGKRILVDPVFSGHASPVSFTTRSFDGSDVYTAGEMPEIDYLLLTHDHWDHLDYETILKLKNKVRIIVTGLGLKTHLQRWGLDEAIIIEKDWDEEVILDPGFTINTTSARHFSGRGLKRNKSIWLSMVLKTPTMNLFLGGDSGYDTHFKSIGDKFGPFNLVILECGQYNEYWRYIHMLPEEVVQAAIDLKGKVLLPVHWAKFSLGLHSWDEPITRVTAEASKKNMPVIHPMIGEATDLNHIPETKEWWLGIM
jgi:L-ascorbate metabolism protein UlaG (beta-lactamase superfamily)